MEFEYRVSVISGVPSSSEASGAHARVEDGPLLRAPFS